MTVLPSVKARNEASSPWQALLDDRQSAGVAEGALAYPLEGLHGLLGWRRR